jgi:molecular chaperone GrpE (heat shock protein)
MRDALFEKQRQMLEANLTVELLYTIDDVQRAIEWVDHEIKKRSFRQLE